MGKGNPVSINVTHVTTGMKSFLSLPTIPRPPNRAPTMRPAISAPSTVARPPDAPISINPGMNAKLDP